MTEVQDALHHSFAMLHHPLQVLELQISNADMSDNTFLLQFNKSRKRLIHNFLQTSRHWGLELNIVHIDKVNEVNIEAFHTFINTFCSSLCRIVPRIDTILAITPYLCGEEILVARNPLQSFPKNSLCLIITIVRANIYEVDAPFNGSFYGSDAFLLLGFVENTSKRRSTKGKVWYLQSCLA